MSRLRGPRRVLRMCAAFVLTICMGADIDLGRGLHVSAEPALSGKTDARDGRRYWRRSGASYGPAQRAARSVPLNIHNLPQRVPHPHERSSVSHDLIDRLVGRGDLVDEGVGVPVLDSDHRLPQVGGSELLPSR